MYENNFQVILPLVEEHDLTLRVLGHCCDIPGPATSVALIWLKPEGVPCRSWLTLSCTRFYWHRHHHPEEKTARLVDPREPVLPWREAEEQLKFMGGKDTECVSVLSLVGRDASNRGGHEEWCRPAAAPFAKGADAGTPTLSCGTGRMITVASTMTTTRNRRGIITTTITSIFFFKQWLPGLSSSLRT